MTESSMVKGVVIRGILRDIKETFPGGVSKFLEHFPQGFCEKHFSRQISYSAWCSYEAFTVTLETYLRVIGNDVKENIEGLGERSATRDINAVLKVYATFTSPHRVGQHTSTVWVHRFKNCGSFSMVDKLERSFRLVLKDFKDIHPLNCFFITGYGLGMGRAWNKAVKVSHDQCIHRGDENCSWLSSW